MLEIILYGLIVLTLILVAAKIDLTKNWRYAARENLKKDLSAIDYCLKGLENEPIEIQTLRDIDIPDKIQFSMIDTVLVHETGVYIIDPVKHFSPKKVQQYKVSLDILAGFLKVEVKSLTLFMVCRGKKYEVSDWYYNVSLVSPGNLKKTLLKQMESREKMYTSAQMAELCHRLSAYANRNKDADRLVDPIPRL